jgi:class 3 adenylate cyclase
MRMLEIRANLKDTLGIAVAYNNIGNIYYYLGDYAGALDNYIRSLHFEQLKPDDEGLATSFTNIGSVYALQSEYQTALTYFRNALLLYEQSGDLRGVAICYSNMGNAYKSIDSVAVAKEYYDKAIALMVSVKDDYNLAIAYSNLADAYRILGDTDLMLEYYVESEQMREALGDQLGLAHLWGSRGLGLVELKRYAEAIEDCRRSLDLAESYAGLGEMKDACQCLYQAYKSLNQNELALIYHERLNRVRDSMAIDEVQTKLRIMEFRNEAVKDSIAREEEKLAVAAKHARELRTGIRERNLFLFLGIVLIVILFIVFRILRRFWKRQVVSDIHKTRADQLLLNVLPEDVMNELLATGELKAREFVDVAVLFTDFIGFTRVAELMQPQEILTELNFIYGKFDEIVARHNIRKIKSIGDSYMAAGGLPISSRETTRQTILAALDMQAFLEKYSTTRESEGKQSLFMRVGIHVGPVVAGIVGFKNFQYDIWGDTVNLASRMEHRSERGKVNVSKAVYELLQDDETLRFNSRGHLEVKGKGPMEMWFVEKV